MGTAATRTVTIEEYLSNPAYEHREYVNGEVVERNVGTGQHGMLQLQCGSMLKAYLKQNPIGEAYVELHCELKINNELRYRLPDVCVVLGPRVTTYLNRAPELCVEILSPNDSLSDQFAKFEDYFANGCRQGWLALPEENTILVLGPAGAPKVMRPGDAIDGADLLPGLQIPVAELFA